MFGERLAAHHTRSKMTRDARTAYIAKEGMNPEGVIFAKTDGKMAHPYTLVRVTKDAQKALILVADMFGRTFETDPRLYRSAASAKEASTLLVKSRVRSRHAR